MIYTEALGDLEFCNENFVCKKKERKIATIQKIEPPPNPINLMNAVPIALLHKLRIYYIL